MQNTASPTRLIRDSERRGAYRYYRRTDTIVPTARRTEAGGVNMYVVLLVLSFNAEGINGPLRRGQGSLGEIIAAEIFRVHYASFAFVEASSLVGTGGRRG